MHHEVIKTVLAVSAVVVMLGLSLLGLRWKRQDERKGIYYHDAPF